MFHVYRHLRRRENDRQEFIQKGAEKEIKDIEFQERLMANKLAADQRTNKKRAKRYVIDTLCILQIEAQIERPTNNVD